VAALAAGPEVDVRPVSLRRRRGVPAGAVAAAVRAGMPYPGFSAGAVIAARTALVGFPVDVHTGQAGTLGRTVALVASGAVEVTRRAAG
jgi:hypothetical protein